MNGIRAIDRKHVIVQQPSNSGSRYYDYNLKGKTPLSYWLYLGLATSAFGRVLGKMVVCQTPPYGKIVTSKSTEFMSQQFEFIKAYTLVREGNASTICPDRRRCL